MTSRHCPHRGTTTRFVVLGCLAAVGLTQAAQPAQADGVHRQVHFKLTFANCDLVWHGDPASPAALVYLRPGAEPIASDVRVTTLIESTQSPQRRYLHEARIADQDGQRVVYAFTEKREKNVGTVDGQERFVPNEFFAGNRKLLPTWPVDTAVLAYDPRDNALYYEVDLPGPVVTEVLDFLPLEIHNAAGERTGGSFSIEFTTPSDAAQRPTVELRLAGSDQSITLATAQVPAVFRREEVQLGSFDNQAGTYLTEAAYRASSEEPGSKAGSEPSVTFEFVGQFTAAVDADGLHLVARETPTAGDPPPVKITIDGNFDDWRNVPGVSDPRGNVVPYLEYVPDVDLLEFKVAHDDEHLYLYARVAGQVGRTHPDGGRSYFYAYIDVDQNPETGFLPSRDDECYYGVEIGDDCEVQFEFVDNQFRKSFYGFCGLGGDDDVLKQVLTLGKSQYGRFDEQGQERAHYKSEYIYRDGQTEITEDLKLGSSDSIRVAVSPDGSEVEISSTFAGFLKDRQGRPILGPGQTIDAAAGMESDSKLYPGKKRWGADSTLPIRGYHLKPSE